MKPLLTQKEIKIIDLICQQYTSKEIGLKLNRSKRTIDSHRQFIYKKTNCNSIIGLVRYALTNGIFSVNNFDKTSASAKTEIDLTAREIQVIGLLCQEYSSAEIGKRLKLSGRTVEDYRVAILNKTRSKTAVGILFFAIKNDMVEFNFPNTPGKVRKPISAKANFS